MEFVALIDPFDQVYIRKTGIIHMPARIPQVIKNSVINDWLLGEPTRTIAINNGISEGSVVNIVNDYKKMIGPALAELLRSLAVAMSKTGITADQCAQTHRLIMIMKRIGITNPDEYEKFLTDVSNQYVEAGLDPARLFEHINELHFFLEKNKGSQGRTSVLQFEAIIEAKKSEEKKLDESVQILKSQQKELEKSISGLKFEKAKIQFDLQWDSELKGELDKNEFTNIEVAKFVKAATALRERGYEMPEIIEKFSELEKLSDKCADIERSTLLADLKFGELSEKNKELVEQLDMNSQAVKNLGELDEMGFGLREFKQLQYLIEEVAQQNGITRSGAVRHFFNDLENYYYDYVWLKRRVAELRAEKSKLSATDSLTFMKELLINSTGYVSKKAPPNPSDAKSDMKQSSDQPDMDIQQVQTQTLNVTKIDIDPKKPEPCADRTSPISAVEAMGYTKSLEGASTDLRSFSSNTMDKSQIPSRSSSEKQPSLSNSDNIEDINLWLENNKQANVLGLINYLYGKNRVSKPEAKPIFPPVFPPVVRKRTGRNKDPPEDRLSSKSPRAGDRGSVWKSLEKSYKPQK